VHTRENRRLARGLSAGSIAVFLGIFLMIVWTLWVGLFVIVLGVLAFEGFARGRWDLDTRFRGKPG
jgi:hypothetical protein